MRKNDTGTRLARGSHDDPSYPRTRRVFDQHLVKGDAAKRDRCYIIDGPEGPLRIHAAKKPNATTARALRELFVTAHRALTQRQLGKGNRDA